MRLLSLAFLALVVSATPALATGGAFVLRTRTVFVPAAPLVVDDCHSAAITVARFSAARRFVAPPPVFFVERQRVEFRRAEVRRVEVREKTTIRTRIVR